MRGRGEGVRRRGESCLAPPMRLTPVLQVVASGAGAVKELGRGWTDGARGLGGG